MYTATMEYRFTSGSLARGLEIWKATVLPAAQNRPGLHRMLVLSQPGDRLLALGIWKDKADAEAFMQTGIFKTLKENLAGLLASEPEPRIWNLEAELP